MSIEIGSEFASLPGDLTGWLPGAPLVSLSQRFVVLPWRHAQSDWGDYRFLIRDFGEPGYRELLISKYRFCRPPALCEASGALATIVRSANDVFLAASFEPARAGAFLLSGALTLHGRTAHPFDVIRFDVNGRVIVRCSVPPPTGRVPYYLAAFPIGGGEGELVEPLVGVHW